MPSSLQARKQSLVRDAIWDAAMDLFASRGFEETTVDDIAAAAGVSRRSFFRYFSSKNDLMAHGIGGFGASIAAAIAACPAGEPLPSVFRRVVADVACSSAAHPRARQIMGIAAKHAAAREAQRSQIAALQDRVTAAFVQRYGRTPACGLVPEVLASTLLSVLSVSFHLWFVQGPGDIAVTVERVLATLGALAGEGDAPAAKRATGKGRGRSRPSVSPPA